MTNAQRGGVFVACFFVPIAVGAPPRVELHADVVAEQRDRIATVERISRCTVAVFERDAGNGGSGVIVSADGLVVTNWHVTEPCGPRMLCGTNDGRVHDAVLLGLDPTGDIALIRLLGDGPFPAATLGDSDSVAVGDPAFVVGNPLLLAEDFTPSVSAGVISGVHRYQHPSGSLLEYADCLQTDAAINPGNSGGPLFDGQGRLIGINGRASFEKRGRVNVGVGYAVSINQVKRFLSPLSAGRLVDHASLGVTVATRSGPIALVTAIDTQADAYRRGLRAGDEIVSVDNRDTPTANAFLNAVGVLPAGWRTRIEYRRDGRLESLDARLGPLHAPGELVDAITKENAAPLQAHGLDASLYASREGYANYAANRAATDRLLAACRADTMLGLWQAERHEALRNEAVRIRVSDTSAEWESSSGEFRCDPSLDLSQQAAPPAAPALLGALWAWRSIAAGEDALLDQVEAIGALPWEAFEKPHDVLRATHRGLIVEFYLDPLTLRLRGIEASRDASEDAVRIDFGTSNSMKAQEGDDPLPNEWTVRVGDRVFAEFSKASEAGESQ